MRISDWSSDVCSSYLDRKRVTVMHNQRSISSKSDRAQRLQGIQALSIEDLVNCEMFFRQNSADVDAIAKTLISKGGPDGFRVLHHIFPDSPRDMNDNFVALAQIGRASCRDRVCQYV